MQSGCKGEVMVKNGTDQIYGWRVSKKAKYPLVESDI